MANPAIQAVTATFGGILYSGRLSTTSATSVYTVPSSKTVKIAANGGTVCNTSGSPVSFSMALLKSGDTDDGTHTVVAAYLLNAGETLSLRDYIGGAMLAEAEAISMTAGTASVIDVVISGAVSS